MHPMVGRRALLYIYTTTILQRSLYIFILILLASCRRRSQARKIPNLDTSPEKVVDGGAPPLHRSKSNMPIKTRNSSKPLPAGIDSLPEELLFEILARLPADFLFRMARFVCPKWNKIIRSQAFINAHGDRHSTNGLLLTSYSNRVYVLDTQGRIEPRKLMNELRRGRGRLIPPNVLKIGLPSVLKIGRGGRLEAA